MRLINSYVDAIKRNLPETLRDEIGREIASSLLDELDALEAATGSSLTDAQIAEAIKRRGHPVRVAASYCEDRALISAQTFSLYIRTLTAVGVLVASVTMALALFGRAEVLGLGALRGVIYNLYWSMLSVFTWITIIFFCIDKWLSHGHIYKKWNPLRLTRSESLKFPIGKSRAIYDLIGVVVLLVFVTGVTTIEGRWLNASQPVGVALSEGVSNWVLLVNTALVLGIGVSLYCFIDPYWTKIKLLPYALIHLVVALGLGVIGFSAGSITLSGAQLPVAHSESIILTVRLLLFVGAIRSGALAGYAIWRFRVLQLEGARPNDPGV